MNRFETKDADEAQAKYEEILKNPNHAVDAFRLEDGTFRLTWIELPKYTAQDGKQYTDEAWVTKEGDVIAVQDLSEAHAKNIIRMMLRQQREQAIFKEQFLRRLQEGLLGTYDEDDEVLGGAMITDPTSPTDTEAQQDAFSVPGDAFYIKGSDTLQ